MYDLLLLSQISAWKLCRFIDSGIRVSDIKAYIKADIEADIKAIYTNRFVDTSSRYKGTGTST